MISSLEQQNKQYQSPRELVSSGLFTAIEKDKAIHGFFEETQPRYPISDLEIPWTFDGIIQDTDGEDIACSGYRVYTDGSENRQGGSRGIGFVVLPRGGPTSYCLPLMQGSAIVEGRGSKKPRGSTEIEMMAITIACEL